MEQLQRLAETIAEVFVRDLVRNTGSNVFVVDDVTRNVEAEPLSAGLFGNALFASREDSGQTDERKAFWLLADLIILDGPEYRLTQHGSDVIRMMIEISLRKQITRKNKTIH